MVEPMTMAVAGMVAVAAVSSIAQFLNSEKGRRLEAQERKRLEGLIDKLEAPSFDTSKLTPPDLKLLEIYAPKSAELVYEVQPELVTAQGARQLQSKAAQDAALERFRAVSEGRDLGDDVLLIKALDDAAERSMAQRNAILADLERRGASPSSSAFAQFQFGAANAGQGAMYDAAVDAALAQLQIRDAATQNAANLGGSILGFETDIESRNKDIINRVNERNTQARRNFLQNRANLENEAMKLNQANRQRIFEQNQNALYQAEREARDLRNEQEAARYNADASKLNLKIGQSALPSIRSKVQDQNQAMQGLSNAAIMGALIYGQNAQKVRDTNDMEYDYSNAQGSPGMRGY